jgi:hypothetical protein
MAFAIFSTYPHGVNLILSCFWVYLSITKVIVKAFSLEKGTKENSILNYIKNVLEI